MSIYSPGYQLALSQALKRLYETLDPRELTVGDHISYETADAIPDQIWAEEVVEHLRRRSMCLLDDGGSHVVAWRYAKDGSWLDEPATDAGQPETASA